MPNPTGQQDNTASGLVPLGFEGPDFAASYNTPASTGYHTGASAYSTASQQCYMANDPVPIDLQGCSSATDYTTAYDGYPTGPSQYSTAGVEPLVMSDPSLLSPAAGYLAGYVPPSTQYPMFPTDLHGTGTGHVEALYEMAQNDHSLYESGIASTNLATPDGLLPTGGWFEPTLLESEAEPLEVWDWAAGYLPKVGC